MLHLKQENSEVSSFFYFVFDVAFYIFIEIVFRVIYSPCSLMLMELKSVHYHLHYASFVRAHHFLIQLNENCYSIVYLNFTLVAFHFSIHRKFRFHHMNYSLFKTSQVRSSVDIKDKN